MKISKATAYSLHAMMYMVRHVTQLPATTNTIAKAEGIPVGYLAKIFQKLVKAGLVKAGKEGMFLRGGRKIFLCLSFLMLLKPNRCLVIVC